MFCKSKSQGKNNNFRLLTADNDGALTIFQYFRQSILEVVLSMHLVFVTIQKTLLVCHNSYSSRCTIVVALLSKTVNNPCAILGHQGWRKYPRGVWIFTKEIDVKFDDDIGILFGLILNDHRFAAQHFLHPNVRSGSDNTMSWKWLRFRSKLLDIYSLNLILGDDRYGT